MKRTLSIFLIIVFIIDLIIIGFQWSSDLRFYTKPLLIPILILYYLCSVTQKNCLFIAGLVMSFLGDLFLMFSWGFIAGLTSFLIDHILYILVFKDYFKHKNVYIILFILIYISALYSFLFPYLGTMKIPVLLYAITIGTMLHVALGTKLKWLMVGAVLFVLSDTILAVNIFYQKSLIGSLSVMLTYVLAQYCLVEGMINKRVE